MQIDRHATTLADEASRDLGKDDGHETVSASGYALFVVPNKRGDGFRASVRGHMFELADPDAPRGLVPTPEELRAVAVASDVAWFARRLLREQGLDDYVSVSARVGEGERLPGHVDVTVDLSADAVESGGMLTGALERRLAAQAWRSARLRIRRA